VADAGEKKQNKTHGDEAQYMRLLKPFHTSIVAVFSFPGHEPRMPTARNVHRH
jgi:hypothetical protein